jgi:hypothetical protein
MADFIDSSSALRQVPQNIDAEVNLLGGLIQDAEGFTEILAILDEESFYLEKHQIILESLNSSLSSRNGNRFGDSCNNLRIARKAPIYWW